MKVTTQRLSALRPHAPLQMSQSHLTIGIPCAAWVCWVAMLMPFMCSVAFVTTSHFTSYLVLLLQGPHIQMGSAGFHMALDKAINGSPAANGACLGAGQMVSMPTAGIVDQGQEVCMKRSTAPRIYSFHEPTSYLRIFGKKACGNHSWIVLSTADRSLHAAHWPKISRSRRSAGL